MNVLREILRGKTVRSMSAEFGDPFSAVHAERLRRYSDVELLQYAEILRSTSPERWPTPISDLRSVSPERLLR